MDLFVELCFHLYTGRDGARNAADDNAAQRRYGGKARDVNRSAAQRSKKFFVWTRRGWKMYKVQQKGIKIDNAGGGAKSMES